MRWFRFYSEWAAKLDKVRWNRLINELSYGLVKNGVKTHGTNTHILR